MNNEMLSSFSSSSPMKGCSYYSKFIKIQQKKPFSLTKYRELEWWFTKTCIIDESYVEKTHKY
jgi:hypothetical protein